MTGEFYFLLDGVSSLDMHIELTEEPPIQIPEERGETKTVLGLAGDLFEPEGEGVYDPYITVLHAGIEGVAAMQKAQKWLRGDHLVTFSTEPDRAQAGRILAGSSFKRVSADMDWFEGDITFKLQPYKYRLHPETVTLNEEQELINLGDAEEYPIITVEGNGAFALSVDDEAPLTFTVDGKAIIQHGAVRDTAANFLATSGTFPVIPVGHHTLRRSAGFTVTVQRKERFL